MTVKPYNTGQTKKEEVREMFDNIAPKYDLLNHTLSMNIDRIWRRRVVRIVRRSRPHRILDVATGTGDLAIEMARRIRDVHVLGDPQNKGGWGAYLPVPLAVHYWAAKNRCTVMQTDTLPAKAPGGRTVIAHRFTGGTGGSEVWLYEIVGGKHAWGEQDIDTGEELWKFFSRFVK